MSDDRQAVNLPPLPTFTIDQVQRRRDRVCDLLAPWVGRALIGPDFVSLAWACASALGVSGESSRRAVVTSLQHLSAAPPTRYVVHQTAWRLAGNLPLLRRGQSVLPSVWREESGWCAAEVVSARPFLRDRDKPTHTRGTIYEFQVLTGVACPLVLSDFWSVKKACYIARQIGFPAPFNVSHRYEDERQMVGMRLALWSDHTRLGDDGPRVGTTAKTGTFVAHNRLLIKKRRRLSVLDFSCPRSYDRSVPCHTCAAGLDECEVATHHRTYVTRACPCCGRDDAVFDPGARRPYCVECATQIDLGRREAPK